MITTIITEKRGRKVLYNNENSFHIQPEALALPGYLLGMASESGSIHLVIEDELTGLIYTLLPEYIRFVT